MIFPVWYDFPCVTDLLHYLQLASHLCFGADCPWWAYLLHLLQLAGHNLPKYGRKSDSQQNSQGLT